MFTTSAAAKATLQVKGFGKYKHAFLINIIINSRLQQIYVFCNVPVYRFQVQAT